MKLFLIILILFTALSSVGQQDRGIKLPAGSVDEPKPRNTYAVVIGVSKYEKLNDLQYADDDAKLFIGFLLSKVGGKVPAKNILQYLNSEANGNAVETACMQWLNSKSIGKGDRIYFFFAGHGDGYLGDYYMLSHDADTTAGDRNLRIQGNINIADVRKRLTLYTSRGAEVILVVDACRTNNESNAGDKQRAYEFSQISSEAGYGYIPSFYSLFATRDGKPAFETDQIGGGHGLFTWHLVNGLLGNADGSMSHASKDGRITLMELGFWLKSSVISDSKKYFQQEQLPDYSSTRDDNKIIAYVDSSFSINYDSALDFCEKVFNDSMFGPGNLLKERSAEIRITSARQQSLYRLFHDAVKTNNLLGPKSAESYLQSMTEEWSDSELTEEARLTLLSKLIAFSQTKINLYLSGFDVSFVKRMNEETSLSNKRFIEVERISRVNFGDAALYIKKAIALIRDDTAAVKRLEAIHWFLVARSYFDTPSAVSLDIALEAAYAALKRDSGAVHLYFLLGMLEQAKNKNSPKIEQYLLKAVNSESKWSKAHLEIGYLYYKLQQFEKAEKFYRNSITTSANLINAYNNLAILFEARQQYDNAESMYLKALTRNPNDSILKLNLSNFYNQRGLWFKNKTNPDYSIAKRYLFQAIEADSLYVAPYINLGNNFMNEKLYAAAEPFYLKALSLKDNTPFYMQALYLDYKEEAVLYNLGICYFYQEKHQEALVALKHCLKLAAPKSSIAFNASTFLKESERLLLKKSTINVHAGGKIVSIDTTISLLHTAQQYFSLDLIDMAESYFLRALALDSTDCEALRKMGEIKRRQKDYDRSASYFLRCIMANPGDSQSVLQVGKFFISRKNYREAEKIYLDYLKLKPDDKKIISQLINLYYLTDNKKAAKRFEKELLK